jgi:hypothetical protein
MPAARQEIAVAVLAGRVFVLGGFDAQGASTDTVQVYDPRADAWRLVAPLPVVNNHGAAATVAGRLYAFGGTTPRAFVYDSAGDAWREVASMHFTHGGTPAVGVIGGKVYVAGGAGPGMVGNEVEVYDPATDVWTPRAPMGVPRNHTAGGVIGGRFYVVGGRGHPQAATAFEVYDPAANTWAPLPPLPTGRSGIGAAAVGGRLFVFGGELPHLFGNVEVFDPVTAVWQALDPMPVPRHGIVAGTIRGQVYLPGGGIVQGLGPTSIHTVYRIRLPRDTGPARSSRPVWRHRGRRGQAGRREAGDVGSPGWRSRAGGKGALAVGASGWVALVAAPILAGAAGVAAPPAGREATGPQPRLAARDQPARQPVHHGVFLSIPSVSETGCATFPVPAGKRLVIEYVSARADVPPSHALVNVLIITTVGGEDVPHLAPVLKQGSSSLGNDIYIAGQTMRLYADPDSTAHLCATRDGPLPRPAISGVAVGFSGYLEDVAP